MLETILLAQGLAEEIIQIARRAPDRGAYLTSVAPLLDVPEEDIGHIRKMSVEQLVSIYQRNQIVDELKAVKVQLGEENP
ncbi:hypothetical protein [Subtercola boreus]|uniref:Uncharacterized protein n=1 Tax=Subtercola boreus TaxID=120213 RepID=A0A3E0W866_9MICO|nr:hypothetical protein [Subtercola boreus]RFA17550.1 hypothetical protein B7R23_17230 [Subtercola boreus]RFA17577.1 hypothetical protein B7R24_17075 [Subtercola boreus]RFA24168.1 hypothetical protein B7R25_17350 [Subtercola boreus]